MTGPRENCPHCGATAVTREFTDGDVQCIEWHCSCGGSGQSPLGLSAEDTALDIHRQARHGPDPLLLPEADVPIGGSL